MIGLSLVDWIDFASVTMEELRAIHDTAVMVGGVAHAVAWQGRCQTRGHKPDLNAAGDLMQWLGYALTEVEGTAIREAERRQQFGQDDRRVRLALMAPGIKRSTLELLRHVFEAAGLEFLPGNGSGPGMRFREPQG